jgi:hypothetical protein
MPNTPEIKIGLVANLFSRMMHFKQKGDVEIGHTHQFDHLTLLASGSLNVTVEGQSTRFDAPCMIYIHKDKVHELTSLEDSTIAYCIHALREENKNNVIIDPDSIPNGIEPSTLFKSKKVDRILSGKIPDKNDLARLDTYGTIPTVTYKDIHD